MAVFPKVARLKQQLQRTGLQETNQPLFQLIDTLLDYLNQAFITTQAGIASGGGGSANAITALNTDVVATGPGAVVATIQPNVVTYAKIQQVSAGQKLLGRDVSAGNVEELGLGANLEIVAGILQIVTSGGGSGGGLAHNLLSPTHPDTVTASPVIGDVIRAVGVITGEGAYYSPALRSLVEEDFVGIRAAYMVGMNGFQGLGNWGTYAPPELSFVTPTYEEWFLAWEYIDFFLQALIVEDFEGLRAAYVGGLVPGGTLPSAGNSGIYTAYPLDFIDIPSPAELVEEARWERKAIGAEGDVLTVVDGLPEWVAPETVEFPDQTWQDIPFDAADFTASGGTTPTWTVASGDVERWKKQYSYNQLGIPTGVRYALYVRATTVGGTAPTQLRIDIPDIIIGRFASFISIQENNVAINDVYVEYDDAVSTTRLFLNKVAGAVFDTTAAGTYLAFEISADLAP